MNMRTRPKPSTKRKEAEREAQKQQIAVNSLLDKPLKTQVFKLLQDTTAKDFCIRDIEGASVLFHVSQELAFYEDSIVVYSKGSVFATVSMKNKSGKYLSWYEEILEEVKKEHTDKALFKILAVVAPGFYNKYHRVSAAPVAVVSKGEETLVGGTSGTELSFLDIYLKDNQNEVEEVEEVEDGGEEEEELDSTAQAILRARQIQASLGESTEESELTDDDFSESEEAPFDVGDVATDEEEDWDTDDDAEEA